MESDKVQRLGSELARLAAAIVEIADEIKAMNDFGRNAQEANETPKPKSETPAQPVQKAPTLEDVRGILADKASSGHREAVQQLVKKHGVNRLSDIDPSKYAALIKEAKAIK